MEEGLLPWGVVDERDIQIIPDEDFLGYTQIHLFAGIGGFPLGLRRARFHGEPIVTGGFPCQDISNAGKRAGITGARSRLWREMVRCIRVVRPRIVLVENVAALLVRGMGDVLGDLAEVGYDAEGDCISAADVGAPHLRRRIWIVAYPHESGPPSEWDGGPAWSDDTISASSDELSDASIGGTRTVSAGSWAKGIGTPNLDGSGEAMADSECSERWPLTEGRNERNGDNAGRKETTSWVGTSGEVVAHPTSTRLNGGTGKEQSFCGRPLLPARSSGRSEMADANGGRCEQRKSDQRSVPILDAGSRWPVEPDVGRVAHGIPKRVDRLAALGDAIVPACVEEVVRRLVLGKFYT